MTRTVVEPIAVQPTVVGSDEVVRRTWGAFSASQVLHALCGVFMVVFGAVAVGRVGFADPVGEHTSEVLGMTVTVVIGLAMLGAGLLLLLAALSPTTRGFGGVVGVVLLVGGVVIAAGSDQLLSDIHTESALGWIGIVVGAVAMIAAFLPAHFISRRTVVAER